MVLFRGQIYVIFLVFFGIKHTKIKKNFRTFTSNLVSMDENNSNGDRLVVLRSYDNPLQAQIAKSVLDSAAIFCVLHDDYMSSIYSSGAFPVRLMVREQDLESAESLLLIEH